MWRWFSARRQPSPTPTVVVIGMGDTGVLTAAHLPRSCKVIGITTKPWLVSGQELGQRLTDPANWRKHYLLPLKAFRRLRRAELVHGRATAVDLPGQTVTVATATGTARTLAWDALVIATGVSNGFWRDAAIEDITGIEHRLQNQIRVVQNAPTIAVVGGGPSGTSLACNIKKRYPEKTVNWFFSGELPLPGYHPKTRAYHRQVAAELGVEVRSGHRGRMTDPQSGGLDLSGTLHFSNSERAHAADLILWATGKLQPHTDFLPEPMLTAEGFVQTDEYLRVLGCTNVYAICDVADTDPLRCSARNWAYRLLCRNIANQLQGRPPSGRFQPPDHRWGSILGSQPEGLLIHQPGGGRTRLPRWVVNVLLFPWIVHRWIYGGLRRMP
jgi:NADH dehydrogenase FAD-containing subunit